MTLRGLPARDAAAIEIASGQNVTIRNLSLTGGEWGFVGNDADGLLLADSRAFNNAAGGFYVNTDASDVMVSGNEAYGTTGNTATDQDLGFQLRGDRMTVFGNRAYKIGALFGDGIDVDSNLQLTFHDNLAYNNINGITIGSSQAEIYNNETRNNQRGLYATDDNANARTRLHDNSSHDNSADGIYLESNIEAFNNTSVANGASGFVLTTNSGNTLAHDNYSSRNATGIYARTGQAVHNRVVG